MDPRMTLIFRNWRGFVQEISVNSCNSRTLEYKLNWTEHEDVPSYFFKYIWYGVLRLLEPV
ncbi:hypothetical protein Holit_01329 [Hollandina sp. SP2]